MTSDIIGTCCYREKCVLRTRVVSIQYFAAVVGYRLYLSSEVMPTTLKLGRQFYRDLRVALLRYVRLRRLGVPHDEALSMVLTNDILVPLGKAQLYDYVVKVFNDIYTDAKKVVRAAWHRGLLPPTGWRFLSDETRTRAPLFINKYYLLPMVRHLLNGLPRVYTSLVFCDDDRCYPAPRGLWPSRDWIWLADVAKRRDIVDELTTKHRAYDITTFIADIWDQIEDSAISVKPGRKYTWITVYLKVPRPDEIVDRAGRFQEDVAKVMEYLHNLIASRGAEALRVSIDDRIAQVVDEVLFGVSDDHEGPDNTVD